MRTRLTVPGPFSLQASIDSHGWLWAAPTHPQGAGVLDRIERLDGRAHLIRIRQTTTTPERTTLSITSDAPAPERDTVRRAVRTMLGLDEDLTAFYAMAARKPRLRATVTHGVGRSVRGSSLWEDCIKGIAQTNIQWRQALVIIERICTLGPHHADTGRHAFPSPGEILDAGPDWLRDEARVGYRADAILTLAAEIKDGTRDLAALERDAPHMGTHALVTALTDIRGIGPATAHTLAGMLGKHDVVSVDSATIDYVRRHYPRRYAGDKPTPREAAAVFDHYGSWKGKAWWYEAWLANHVNGQGTAAAKRADAP